MSTYYEFVGRLEFPSAATAAAAFALLRETQDSLFWSSKGARHRGGKALVLAGRELAFEDRNFAGGEPFYTTRALLAELVKKAKGGRVRVQEGDGSDGTIVEYFGFKPKKKAPAKAKKTAPAKAKKPASATAKKPAPAKAKKAPPKAKKAPPKAKKKKKKKAPPKAKT